MYQLIPVIHVAIVSASGGHDRGLIEQWIDALIRGFGWQLGKSGANFLFHGFGPVLCTVLVVALVGIWRGRRKIRQWHQRIKNRM